jgi:hypothetical protein
VESNLGLADQLIDHLRAITVLPRRMRLETPSVQATASMLRGVWGAALHDLSPVAYRDVFEARRDHGDQRPQGYVIRLATLNSSLGIAFEWILIGDAIHYDEVLRRAWDIASKMSLGSRRRQFYIREAFVLGPKGSANNPEPWTLDHVKWSWPNIGQPCRLSFPVPLRILRYDRSAKRDRLIQEPTPSDLIVAACRRLRGYIPANRWPEWDALTQQALAVSRQFPASPWHGNRLDFHRYSERQLADQELRGVSGWLDLPNGPGELWPLFAAAQWLHLGKGTTMGLGQIVIQSIEPELDQRSAQAASVHARRRPKPLWKRLRPPGSNR